MQGFDKQLQRALERRAPLHNQSNAYRVFNALGDGQAGITIDRLHETVVLGLYQRFTPAQEEFLLQEIAQAMQPKAIYLKRRPKEARHLSNTNREWLAPTTPAWGQPVPEQHVLEEGRVFALRPGGDLSYGLFLDMRETRTWLSSVVAGKTVLNTYAYTCAFGVAALQGHAARVLHLDVSRRVLDWGEQNYQLSGYTPQRADFLAGDVFDWLQRFAKKTQCFDVVILDPPSFARVDGKTFAVEHDYHHLVALAAQVVAPQGMLLACCNHAGMSQHDFDAHLEQGLQRAQRWGQLRTRKTQSPIDFPVPANTEPPLKVVAIDLD